MMDDYGEYGDEEQYYEESNEMQFENRNSQ